MEERNYKNNSCDASGFVLAATAMPLMSAGSACADDIVRVRGTIEQCCLGSGGTSTAM